MAYTNWAGNYTYRARRLHRPASVEQAQDVIAAAPRVRVLGSRHTFTAIADSDELVSLDELPQIADVDPEARSVRVSGAVRYGELAGILQPHRLALPNLASLPHISIAGAVATATHGSGSALGNLATPVTALELITSSGELIELSRGEPEFAGAVVGLGALGAVTTLTLELEPATAMSQRVYEGLAWEALFEHFDEIMSAGTSVSVFTLWGDELDQVWVKSRVGEDAPLEQLYGARAATTERHPIAGLDRSNCNPQLGAPGPWSERLPHFRMGFTPSSGEEIQSEFLLARQDARAAIEAVRALAPAVSPLLQISELRTIAADQLWMSPQYGRETVGIHFTWKRRQEEVERTLARLEEALLPLGARPHWGKLFLAEASEVAPLYERLEDFRALVARLDPRGAFRNSWLDAHVLGS